MTVTSILPIKITNGNRREPCAFVCTGVTSNNWVADSTDIWIYIDISSCGFVERPTLPTTLDAGGFWQYKGGIIYWESNTRIRYSLDMREKSGHSASGGKSTANSKFKVNWIAIDKQKLGIPSNDVPNNMGRVD